MRRPALRRLLNQERRRADRAGNDELVESIDHALLDDNLFETLADGVDEEYSRSLGRPAGFGGGIADFVRWIFEHRESILKLLAILVTLFAQNDES